jgi:hypothetical protein
MGRGDLSRPELEPLDWSPDARAASLTTVFTQARDYGAGAEAWYGKHRGPKRLWARVLRVGAILLGIAAAVLPILSQIFGQDEVDPAWSAVALALAAGLVGLDRYHGFSISWMRYMSTELALTRQRHEFAYAWQQRLTTVRTPPSDDDVKDMLKIARDYVLRVDDTITAETSEWAKEFLTALSASEQQLAGPPAQAP